MRGGGHTPTDVPLEVRRVRGNAILQLGEMRLEEHDLVLQSRLSRAELTRVANNKLMYGPLGDWCRDGRGRSDRTSFLDPSFEWFAE